MTQIPPSNQRPLPGNKQDSPSDQMGLASRVSTIMFIVAGLAGTLSLCCGVTIASAPKEAFDRIIESQHLDESMIRLPPGFSLDQMLRISFIVMAAMGFVVAGVLALLAMFVRRGSKTGTIISAVVCALLAFLMAIRVLGAVFMAFRGNGMAVLEACISVVPLAIFSFITVMLLRLYRILPQAQAIRQQWQVNYAASLQQQQAYMQSPHGFGLPPPPPGYAPPPGSAPVGSQSGIGYSVMPPPPPPPPADQPGQTPDSQGPSSP